MGVQIIARALEWALVNMKDDWGGPNTYPHFHAGWAMAGNTPFKYFKQIVHNGGIADALVISWPKGIKAKGEVRNQYHHITDIGATILDYRYSIL